MKIICIILSFLFTSHVACSQKVYTVTQRFDITVFGPYFEVLGFLPRDIYNRQKVVDVRFSSDQIELIEQNGSKYFRLTERVNQIFGQFPVVIEYDIELFEYDLKTAKTIKRDYINNDTTDLKDYLKPEKFIRIQNESLQEAASKITGENDLEVVHHIFDYVVQNLDYNNDMREDVGAIRALKKGQGDCTEYTDLMVALCRIKGIPARSVLGLVTKTTNNPHHNWCEVFLKDYGWVPFDPTFSDDDHFTTFENMDNAYIYLSKKRIDPKLGRVAWRCKPVNSVQITAHYECSYKLNEAIQKAFSFYDDCRYEEAFRDTKKLLKNNPKSIKLIILKAMILLKMERLDEANRLFQFALYSVRHNDERVSAYYAFGKYLSMKGQHEVALTYIKRAIDYGFRDLESLKTSQELEEMRKTQSYKDFMSG